MPIITPAYPSMCATYNITNSSMSVIKRELQRGGEISDLVMTGKRPWSDLFIKHNFFTSDYKYYLAVVSASLTKEAHKVWSGFVESKVRVLVQNLERHESIALAHPYTKGYERIHRCKDDSEIDKVQQGCLDFVQKDVSLDASGQQPPSKEETPENITTVFTTTHYIGLQLNEGIFPSKHYIGR
jgi:poly(A) polymerase